MAKPKILMIVGFDWANAAYKMYEAINEFGDVASIRLWTRWPFKAQGKRKGYKYDMKGNEQLAEAKNLVKEADVIHFIDRAHPALSKSPLPALAPPDKKAIVSLNTSAWYSVGPGRVKKLYGKIKNRNQNCLITTLTASMPLQAIPFKYTPQPIDTRKIGFREKVFSREKLVVGHMPFSGRFGKKGTREIQEALKRYEKAELRITTGASQEEAIARKRKLDVLIDQLVLGAYGYNALEAACIGIPVMCHLKEDCWPLINCRRDGTDIPQKLDWLQDRAKRKTVGKKTRRWVEETHGYPVIGKMWSEIYRDFC